MIYSKLHDAIAGRGLFSILIDPDKYKGEQLDKIAKVANSNGADFFMLGGSIVKSNIESTLIRLKSQTDIPIILFPGSALQFVNGADAILLLSLISGRNADFLIGHHVLVSNSLKESRMEVIPTGYMLINDGTPTSVQYMSNTLPIPSTKHDIAVATALAGEQLGLKAIYLEAGSGAANPVDPTTIKLVYDTIKIPIIVGGGIRTSQQVKSARNAGAAMIVVGNSIEKNPENLIQLIEASR